MFHFKGLFFYFKGLFWNNPKEPQFENGGNNSFCVRKYLSILRLYTPSLC